MSVAASPSVAASFFPLDFAFNLIFFILGRPKTDLVSSLGFKPKDVSMKLNVLLKEKLLRKSNKYFVAND